MDLNQIHLNPLMLADLYGSQLIETDLPDAPAPPPVLSYLGENKKGIAVLVDHPTAPLLPDEELQFLTTVLAACKLGLADIAIANIHLADSSRLQELTGSCRQVLLLGVAPLSINLPINFPYFQLQPFNNRTYLHAPPLAEIEKDKGLKMQLWNSLKQLFGL